MNPLRANLVADLVALDNYAYSGHRMLVGKVNDEWQDAKYVLARFDKIISTARQRYRLFVQEGVSVGQRPELTGGGLIRSLGGWRNSLKSLEQTGVEKVMNGYLAAVSLWRRFCDTRKRRWTADSN